MASDRFIEDLKRVIVLRVKARIVAHINEHGSLDGDVLGKMIDEESEAVFGGARDLIEELVEEVIDGP